MEVAADFAVELEGLLLEAGREGLGASVRGLRVVERCPCNDPSCASFYTVPRSNASWLWCRGGETVELRPSVGTLSVDAVDETIVSLEVRRRESLREILTHL